MSKKHVYKITADKKFEWDILFKGKNVYENHFLQLYS